MSDQFDRSRIRYWPLSASGKLIPESPQQAESPVDHPRNFLHSDHLSVTVPPTQISVPSSGSYQLITAVATLIQTFGSDFTQNAQLTAGFLPENMDRENPIQRSYQYHSLRSTLPTHAMTIPSPLAPIPLITVSPLIAHLAQTQPIPTVQEIPAKLRYLFAPFGENSTIQNATLTQFFQLIIALATQSNTSAIEKILRQLGRDYQKFQMKEKDIHKLISYWEEIFTPITHAGFLHWIGSFSRAILAGLSEIIPIYQAHVTKIIRPEPDYMIIQLLSAYPIPFSAGQYVEVSSSRHSNKWRYCSIATPGNPLGQIDFHLRGKHVFIDTQVDDLWYIGQVHGQFAEIATQAQSLTLIGVDTGLAPFRSIILSEYLYRRVTPIHLISITSQVHWFEQELYAELSQQSDWFELNEIYAPTGEISLTEFLSHIHRWNDHFILSGPVEISHLLRNSLLKLGIKPEQITQADSDILGINSA